MGEVRDEHPRGREADASKEGHGEHEPPSLAQWPTQWIGAQEPHEGPQGQHEGIVVHTSWNPFLPEVFVASCGQMDKNISK